MRSVLVQALWQRKHIHDKENKFCKENIFYLPNENIFYLPNDSVTVTINKVVVGQVVLSYRERRHRFVLYVLFLSQSESATISSHEEPKRQLYAI